MNRAPLFLKELLDTAPGKVLAGQPERDPESEREAVFDQFYRVRSEDRRVAGTGLGLSICRGLVEAHGGKIVIDAGPGEKGTMVTMTLPLEAPPEFSSLPDDMAGDEVEP